MIKMQDATRGAILALVSTDQTIPSEERKVLIDFLNGTAPKAQEAMPRVLKRPEVARLLGLSAKRIDQLTRNGALKKIAVPGQTRSIGFCETSVRNFIVGRAG